MSSTPLFDAFARRSDLRNDSVLRSDSALRNDSAQPGASAVPAPTSPLSAPLPAEETALVPNALVAAIDRIPAGVGAAPTGQHAVTTDQLVLVEAVADAITRAVVDAVVVELERITRDGFVRA
ncbi:hypothetical protein [Curtobacterium caseinilyticum]|uniref:Uncharacterized protein n=1 Tax=Curtobacterium caseinilyticum TaxID=3055137 RepID=A0ABT7TPQ4_9MICO|nr:hypothetical protein [Curtobacterium caseinilyticum]MDM7891334.1 hypothetical protein [Curtobacterium caseinilyticum]